MTERNNYTIYIFFSCGRLLDVCWTLLSSQSFGKPLFKGVEGWTFVGRQEKCPLPSQAMGIVNGFKENYTAALQNFMMSSPV